MTDIGPMLREARMRAGLDIDALEERTKIRGKYLRALENEEWSLLPGSAFTKGFLRTYGDILGLDSRLLIDEYKRQWEEPNDLDVNPVRPTLGRDLREPAWSSGRGRRWALLGLAIVGLAIAFVLVGHLFGSSTPSSAPPARAGASTVTTQPGTVTAAPPSCAATRSHRLPRACVALKIEPTAALYVCLVGDQRVRVAGRTLGTVATPATYHARKFELTLGSRSATLVIDGRRFALPPGHGAVRFEITARRRRRLATPAHLSCSA